MKLRRTILEEANLKATYAWTQAATRYALVAALGVAGSICITMLVALYGGVLVGIMVRCFRMGYAWIG